jgi:hypothetical protein
VVDRVADEFVSPEQRDSQSSCQSIAGEEEKKENHIQQIDAELKNAYVSSHGSEFDLDGRCRYFREDSVRVLTQESGRAYK